MQSERGKPKSKDGRRRHPWAQYRPDPCGCWPVPIYTSDQRYEYERGEPYNSLFDADGFDLDESGSIGRLEAAKLVHG
jgi:hypothetical protein